MRTYGPPQTRDTSSGRFLSRRTPRQPKEVAKLYGSDQPRARPRRPGPRPPGPGSPPRRQSAERPLQAGARASDRARRPETAGRRRGRGRSSRSADRPPASRAFSGGGGRGGDGGGTAAGARTEAPPRCGRTLRLLAGHTDPAACRWRPGSFEPTASLRRSAAGTATSSFTQERRRLTPQHSPGKQNSDRGPARSCSWRPRFAEAGGKTAPA